MFYPDKNFISSLTPAERFIFVKAICGMVAMDGKVTREELLYLKELALKFQVEAESISVMVKSANSEDMVKQVRKITSRPKALMLIKDLCMVANTDGDLEDREIDYILDMAEILGIDGETVKKINGLVNEYLELSQRACIVLEQEHWT